MKMQLPRALTPSNEKFREPLLPNSTNSNRALPDDQPHSCPDNSKHHAPFIKPSKISLLLAFLLAATVVPLQAQLHEAHTFTSVNKVIPDGNAAGVSDTRTVSSAISSITAVKVRLRVRGEFNGDLYAYLTHSNGFTVLLNRPGRTAADSAGYDDAGFDITLDDAATTDIHTYRSVTTPSAGLPLTGTWRPDGRDADPGSVLDTTNRTALLSAFNNLGAAGGWTLFLADLESGGTNLIESWEMDIYGVGTPLITWTAPGDILYGTALSDAQLNGTTVTAGTFAYSPAAGTVLDSGLGRVLTTVFTPDDVASYQKVTNTVTLNVTKAPLTVTAQNKTRLYGDANPAFTATFATVQNGDSISATFATDAVPTSPIGDYDIIPTATGVRLTNYTVIAVKGTLTIGPALLTITAADASRLYGDANPTFTGVISGQKNGETLTGAYSSIATPSSPVGSYPIVPVAGGATITNYSVTAVNGTLTVGQAPLTIVAANATRLYGQANPTFTGVIGGIKNAETITATYATPAVLSSPVGPYSITPTPQGTTLTNYAITTTDGVLTIAQGTLTGLLASSANPALPGSTVTFTYTLSAVAPASGYPTGGVQFKIDGVNSGAPAALNNGVAQLATSLLALGSHTVRAEYTGDVNFHGTTNDLAPDQVINTPPVAMNDTIERYPTNTVKVKLSALLANDSDADGDTLAISVSAVTAHGGTVVVRGLWAYYTPAPGYTEADSFTYTVTDGRGGSATATVTVAIKVDPNATQNVTIVSLGNGSYRLTFHGIPGRAYHINYAESVPSTTWQSIGGGTADALGVFELIDSPPQDAPARFYRSVYP
jgi:subtilisin-like proprotein convertase family protein